MSNTTAQDASSVAPEPSLNFATGTQPGSSIVVDDADDAMAPSHVPVEALLADVEEPFKSTAAPTASLAPTFTAAESPLYAAIQTHESKVDAISTLIGQIYATVLLTIEDSLVEVWHDQEDYLECAHCVIHFFGERSRRLGSTLQSRIAAQEALIQYRYTTGQSVDTYLRGLREARDAVANTGASRPDDASMLGYLVNSMPNILRDRLDDWSSNDHVSFDYEAVIDFVRRA